MGGRSWEEEMKAEEGWDEGRVSLLKEDFV